MEISSFDKQLHEIEETIVESEQMRENAISQGRYYACQVREYMEKLGIKQIGNYQIIKFTAKDVKFVADTKTSKRDRKRALKEFDLPTNGKMLSFVEDKGSEKIIYGLEQYGPSINIYKPVIDTPYSVNLLDNEKVINFLSDLPDLLKALSNKAKTKKNQLAKTSEILSNM